MGDEKKDIPELMVRVMISHYCRHKTKVRMESELFEEFCVQDNVHQGFVLLLCFSQLQWLYSWRM